MISNSDAVALLGKNVKVRNSNVQMWSELIGIRVMYNDSQEKLFLVDFSNGYAANLAEVLELVEQEPPAEETEAPVNPGPASEEV